MRDMEVTDPGYAMFRAILGPQRKTTQEERDRVMQAVDKTPTKATWHKYFTVNDSTGELRWREKHGGYRAGDLAGYIGSGGYNRVGLNGKKHRVRRIIWEMYFGRIPRGYEVASTSPYNSSDYPDKLYIWNEQKQIGQIPTNYLPNLRKFYIGEYRLMRKERDHARAVLGFREF